MRPSVLAPALVLITSFTSSSTALKASSSSPCAPQCGNVLGSTSGSDIACTNDDFKSTPAGVVFQSCVSCQIKSIYVDPVTKQPDLHWAIYNLRYAVSWCLFGFPSNPNVAGTPCATSTACGALESGFEFDSLSLNSSSYAYCALMPALNIPKCTACLQVQSTEFYLTNFVTALSAGCQQQPISGSTVSIDGDLFSTTRVNVTSPSATPISTYSPGGHGLTLGAKIGIAVGTLVAILAIIGFCIVWQGKRRRRRYLLEHQQKTGYAEWEAQQRAAAMTPPQPMGSSPGGFFDSPQSQRPLVSSAPWTRRDEESPASAMGEKVYFSPYSSQYSSPVDANEQFQPIGREWPNDRKSSVGGSSVVRNRSREKREQPLGDGFEMQNVAPVLLHPGHGRGRPLGEEDAKNGYAL